MREELALAKKAANAKSEQLAAEMKKSNMLRENAKESQSMFQKADTLLKKFNSEQIELQRNIQIERKKEKQRLHDAHEQMRRVSKENRNREEILKKLNESIAIKNRNTERLLREKDEEIKTLRRAMAQKEQNAKLLRTELGEKDASLPILQQELVRRKAHSKFQTHYVSF